MDSSRTYPVGGRVWPVLTVTSSAAVSPPMLAGAVVTWFPSKGWRQAQGAPADVTEVAAATSLHGGDAPQVGPNVPIRAGRTAEGGGASSPLAAAAA